VIGVSDMSMEREGPGRNRKRKNGKEKGKKGNEDPENNYEQRNK
jgi:hypothetical protein